MTDSPPPVYLLASERSGTNFLRKKITELQKIYFGPSSAHFLKHLYYREPFYGDLYNDKIFLCFIADALTLCYTHFSPWEVKLTQEEVLADFSKQYRVRNAIILSHYLLMKYARYKGFSSYFCKDNFLYKFVFPTLYYIPEAKFIYLHRDPRDYTLSQLKRTLMTDNVYKIARLWQYEQIKCINAFHHFIEKGKIIRLSYEDLIQNEQKEMDRLGKFLKVPILEKPSKVKNFNLGIAEEWKNLNKQTIKNNFNKFKNELSIKKIKMIESICWDEMKFLGYKTENTNRPKVSIVEKYFSFLWGTITYHLRTKIKKNQGNLIVRYKRSELLRKLKGNF